MSAKLHGINHLKEILRFLIPQIRVLCIVRTGINKSKPLRKKIIVCEYCGRIMIDPDLAGVED